MPVITSRQALMLSLTAAFLTMALKTLAWQLTGSVGYLSDAMESLVNLSGAVFALAMVTYAMRPADAGHPFGHGKAEYFSAAFEGGMIFIAALIILVAAVDRLLYPQAIESFGLGTTLTVVASVINLIVARILLKTGRRERSPAVIADGRHLLTDVWTTAGVVLGVALALVTGMLWLDALVAIAVALHILLQGWHLLREATAGLMDSAVSDDEIATIEGVLTQFKGAGCQFHNLRTRASGSERFANLDMQVSGLWSVKKAHDLANEIEAALAAVGVSAVIHVEPFADTQ